KKKRLMSSTYDEPSSSTLSISDGRARRPGGAQPKPHLFVAMECDRPLAPPARYHLGDTDEVVIGRGNARASARTTQAGARRLVVRVPDRWMSATHAQLIKVFGRWVLEDANSKNGTLLNGTPQKRAFLSDGDVFELGHTLFLFRDALPTLAEDPADVDAGA